MTIAGNQRERRINVAQAILVLIFGFVLFILIVIAANYAAHSRSWHIKNPPAQLHMLTPAPKNLHAAEPPITIYGPMPRELHKMRHHWEASQGTGYELRNIQLSSDTPIPVWPQSAPGPHVDPPFNQHVPEGGRTQDGDSYVTKGAYAVVLTFDALREVMRHLDLCIVVQSANESLTNGAVVWDCQPDPPIVEEPEEDLGVDE